MAQSRRKRTRTKRPFKDYRMDFKKLIILLVLLLLIPVLIAVCSVLRAQRTLPDSISGYVYEQSAETAVQEM